MSDREETGASDQETVRLAFTVFVTGDGPRAKRAIAQLGALCAERLGGEYEIDVVDVLVDPGRAETLNVLATPTVVRTSPAPPLRTVGDLGDADRVAAALGLTDRRPPPPRQPPGA